MPIKQVWSLAIKRNAINCGRFLAKRPIPPFGNSLIAFDALNLFVFVYRQRRQPCVVNATCHLISKQKGFMEILSRKQYEMHINYRFMPTYKLFLPVDKIHKRTHLLFCYKDVCGWYSYTILTLFYPFG